MLAEDEQSQIVPQAARSEVIESVICMQCFTGFELLLVQNETKGQTVFDKTDASQNYHKHAHKANTFKIMHTHTHTHTLAPRQHNGTKT